MTIEPRHTWDNYIEPTKAQRTSWKREKEEREEYKSRRIWNAVFGTWQEPLYSWTGSFYGYLHQIKPVNSSMDEGGAQEAPPWVEELSAIDGCCGRELFFPLAVRLPDNKWPHTYEHAGSTNWIQWVLKTEKRRAWIWERRVLGILGKAISWNCQEKNPVLRLISLVISRGGHSLTSVR